MRIDRLLVLLPLVLGAPTAAAQATLRVPQDAPTVSAAVQLASSGDTILVGPGSHFVVNQRTFGKAIVLRSTDGRDVTFLSANDSNRVLAIQDGEGPDTVIEGFTILAGRAPLPTIGPGNGGGAVLVQNASPTFRDCVVRNSRASGGAVAAPGGNGGGVLVVDGSPLFERCLFLSNEAGSGGTGQTGANGPGGTITSPAGGPGVAGGPGSSGGRGGAVAVTGGLSAPTFVSCVFRGNRAGAGGKGGKGGRGGDALTFLGISAGPGGAGGKGGSGGPGGHGSVWLEAGATARFDSCTFVDNLPGDGGAGGQGGAGGTGSPKGPNGGLGTTGSPSTVAGLSTIGTAVEITNTVLWNPGGSGSEVVGPHTALSCAARTALVGTGNLVLSSSATDADGRPTAGSPLIDAGDASLLPAGLAVDHDGGARLFDSPSAAAGGVLDVGAFERRAGEWVELGCGTNPAGSVLPSPAPRLGAPFTVAVDDPTASFAPGALPILWVASAAAPGPCGQVVTGAGLSPGSDGAVLVDLSTPPFLLLLGPPLGGPGAPPPFLLDVPDEPLLLGARFALQGALFDPVGLRVGFGQGWLGAVGE